MCVQFFCSFFVCDWLLRVTSLVFAVGWPSVVLPSGRNKEEFTRALGVSKFGRFLSASRRKRLIQHGDEQNRRDASYLPGS